MNTVLTALLVAEKNIHHFLDEGRGDYSIETLQHATNILSDLKVLIKFAAGEVKLKELACEGKNR